MAKQFLSANDLQPIKQNLLTILKINKVNNYKRSQMSQSKDKT